MAIRKLSELSGELTEAEIKKVVSRLKLLDKKVEAENDTQVLIEATPHYWYGFFSGYNVKATATCQKRLDGIERRLSALFSEQWRLCKLITWEQAMKYGYEDACCMCEDDFKVES